MKIKETLETVYIYIYIVSFNRINKNKHRKTVYFSASLNT